MGKSTKIAPKLENKTKTWDGDLGEHELNLSSKKFPYLNKLLKNINKLVKDSLNR